MARTTPSDHLVARFPTGIAGLDEVLSGGLFRGGGNLVIGPSGAGKTVLAAQVAFHHVSVGGRAAFLTLLTESHDRLLAHLSTLSFFDPARVPDALYFVSGSPRLEVEGIRGVVDLARALIRDRKLSLLVIDGFGILEEASASILETRRAVQALHSFLGPSACTGLFLAGDRTSLPDVGASDAHLFLEHPLVALRAVRQLHVAKLRGGGFLGGRHVFTITRDGLRVFPRTEARATRAPAAPLAPPDRLSLGIARLDEMLLGGVVAGSSTSIVGAPGTGKTLLGLSFLVAGARRSERGLYFGFNEPPDRIAARCRGIGMPLEEHVRAGRLQLSWAAPMERLLDDIADEILGTVDATGARRVVIDGVDALRLAAVYRDRVPRFVAALMFELRARNVTSVITEESDLHRREHSLAIPDQVVSAVVENVVVLRQVELRARLHRLISIPKVREGAHDASSREFTIAAGGIEVASSVAGAERALSGAATQGAQPPVKRPRRRKGRTR